MVGDHEHFQEMPHAHITPLSMPQAPDDAPAFDADVRRFHAN